MNAPFAPLLIGTAVLRVLTGRLSGAEHRLPPGRHIRVGHGFDHDVVIRDPSTKGLSLELHIGDDVATVRVVTGEAMLLGRPVAAGEEAMLPVYVPLMLGTVAVALGDKESARWAEAERLTSSLVPVADGTAPANLPRADRVERLATRLDPVREAVAFERRWPLYGAGAAALVLLAVAAGPVADAIGTRVGDPAQHKVQLAAAGFPGLDVTRGANGDGPMIRGLVRDDAELARLRTVVAARIGRATIDVDTMQAMAAAATDILRAQGIDAEAKPMRGRTLLVTSEFLPADRQAELGALIRRDLPVIAAVSFASDGARGDRDLQYFFSGGPYGLATFVDGSPGYIVTADGTRWFSGAQVPTGHRIVSIGNGRAAFERQGRIEEIVLGPAVPPAPAPMAPLGGKPSERIENGQ